MYMKNETPKVAIIGMACKYPDMSDYNELWENVLMQRRAFRKFPENRLSDDYFSKDDPDKVYAKIAAVINGYEFDRSKYGISGKNFRSADLTHWLALDIATLALEDAGLMDSDILPKDKTGVFVGNTLTGEFSRANVMRLRWPFVKNKVMGQLLRKEWAEAEIEDFLRDLEEDYKASFPPMYEDSLAGGLANTIAGRICNYHDFHGGGYSVDGACSSSLLSVIEACKSLEAGDQLVSIAGGVDLSLDPFELVGFSRAGALAKKDMLVYDKDSNGFWPGEGCGFVVLANLDFALKNNLHVYAIIKGFGISSDGQGGLTRPAVSGQMLALERTYEKAGYPISEVTYFEGHGTGTEVGDTVELNTLISSLRKEKDDLKKHYIGTIKANIGHTKAAAGIAGLIKIINVVKNRIVPPITGCVNQHHLFDHSPLTVPFQSIPYLAPQSMKASVSAMGFGGINTHITIEGFADLSPEKKHDDTPGIKKNWTSWVFLFSADTLGELSRQVRELSAYADAVSYAELSDLSVALYHAVGKGNCRAAIIASSPTELALRLLKLESFLIKGQDFVQQNGIFLYNGKAKTRIGFLFPGQGSKSFSIGGKFCNEFPWVQIPKSFPSEPSATSDLKLTQPAIVGTSMISVTVLKDLGITGQIGVGHSLGEITALQWSGVLEEDEALLFAKKRGEIMTGTPGISGLMLIVSASAQTVQHLIADTGIEIAAINSDHQTVLSGSDSEINNFKIHLSSIGIASTLLPVKYAFHSTVMNLVKSEFATLVETLSIKPPVSKTISTVSGQVASELVDIKKNLIDQLSSPVRFLEAIEVADQEVDFWIELGGDRTLLNIVKNISNKPLSSMGLDGDNTTGFLSTLALSWALGNQVDFKFLLENLFSKEFNLQWNPSFFTNPCESLVPVLENPKTQKLSAVVTGSPGGLMSAFKTMIAAKLEFPVNEIDVNFRFLDDFHLNSLEVGQLITEFASANDIIMKAPVTEYANASVKELIEVLERSAAESGEKSNGAVSGIEPWVHFYGISEKLEPLPERLFPDVKDINSGWELIGRASWSACYTNEELMTLPGEGLILDLRNCSEVEMTTELILAIEKLNAAPTLTALIVLQSTSAVGGFIKSMFLESAHFHILLLTSKEKIAIETLIEEQRSNTGFKEVIYRNHKRFIPVFEPSFHLKRGAKVDLSDQDLIVITGGGKGITAECALALGRKYKTKLVLLGRSSPELDANLASNLKRFDEAGITYRYYAVNLADRAEVSRRLRSASKDLGKITGFVHGAGLNKPLSWRRIGLADIANTCGAKLLGLRNVLSVLNPSDLKMLVSFGSIIAENGMNGNADYALVNEWLRNEVEAFALLHSQCKCLNLEWSVWSGAGMGEHLGVLEQLASAGVQPISLEKGTSLFLDCIAAFPIENNIIVSGRYGSKSTLKEPHVAIPLLRYLEEVKLFYPGVEIISDFVLSEHTDLYLRDHKIDDEIIFPAVMGLEAMQQVASVLIPGQPFSFQHGRFSYPIVLRNGINQKVRVIATRLSQNQIKVVLRSESTNFCQDHFEAFLMLEDKKEHVKESTVEHFNKPSLDPEIDLYQGLLFHDGIFRVIKDYLHLTPYHCIAKAIVKKNTRFFSEFISANLLSFEPTIRDAALHCVQACVPEFKLLPIGFKKIHSLNTFLGVSSCFTVEAVEIHKEDKLYFYDIYIRNELNQVIEYWEEVGFKVLSDHKILVLPLDLMGIIVQRRTDELLGSRAEFKMITSKTEGFVTTKRYDGKPFTQKGHISKTHMRDLTVQLLTPYQLGCDLEQVAIKEEDHWLALLGQERYNLALYVSRSCKEELSVSATRIWGIAESLKKADLHLMETILFNEQKSSQLHYYKCGNHTVLSLSFIAKEANVKSVFTTVLVNEFNAVGHEEV
jgi:enediyne polyketide synthase